ACTRRSANSEANSADAGAACCVAADSLSMRAQLGVLRCVDLSMAAGGPLLEVALAMLRLRILVVEDGPEITRFYRILFFEHEVFDASTLAEARVARAGREIDAIICDWNLPDGEGGTFLRELAEAGDPAHRIVHSGMEPDGLEDLLDRRIVH